MELQKKKTGSFCAILSAVLFGFNAYCATQAYAGGSNPIAFTFYAALICLVVNSGIVAVCHIRIVPQPKQFGWIVVVGLFGGITTLLLFSSFACIASGIATVLHFTYPVYVAIGSVWILKKKLTKGKVAALLLSVVGIVCISDLSGKKAGLGLGLALLSGITYAGYVIFLEKSGLSNENSMFVCFHLICIKIILTFLFGSITGQLWVRQTTTAWFYTGIQAITALVIASILFQIGVKYVGGLVASVFSMFEPLTCLIVGVFLLGEQINGIKIAGCLLICIGILAVIYDEFHEKKEQ